MRATLSFNLPEEQEEFNTAVNAGKYKVALWDIGQEVFRPARKHGYPEVDIQRCIDYLDSLADAAAAAEGTEAKYSGTELVSMLEDLFYKVLENNEVKNDL